jgi:hypothetical protein
MWLMRGLAEEAKPLHVDILSIFHPDQAASAGYSSYRRATA